MRLANNIYNRVRSSTWTNKKTCTLQIKRLFVLKSNTWFINIYFYFFILVEANQKVAPGVVKFSTNPIWAFRGQGNIPQLCNFMFNRLPVRPAETKPAKYVQNEQIKDLKSIIPFWVYMFGKEEVGILGWKKKAKAIKRGMRNNHMDRWKSLAMNTRKQFLPYKFHSTVTLHNEERDCKIIQLRK